MQVKTAIQDSTQAPTDSLTKENLITQLICLGVKNPEIVFAQAILESGHFKSKLAKKCNNLFGMKMPRKRHTTAIAKSKSGYAVYKHWIASLEDYLAWQKMTLEKHPSRVSRIQYLRYLDKVYCDVKGYSKQLKKLIKQNHKLFVEVRDVCDSDQKYVAPSDVYKNRGF
jgi:uncharacterized FlgJ-related protein